MGSSKNVHTRWRYHLADLRAQRHRNRKLQHLWNKYGEGSLEIVLLERCAEDERIAREQFHIDDRDPWINISKIAGCPVSGPKSAAHRQKIAESNKKRWRDPKLRERVSLKNKGQKRSKETRARIAESQRGRTNTPEANAKRSDTMKRVMANPDHRKRISKSVKKLHDDPDYRERYENRMTLEEKRRVARVMQSKRWPAT